MKETPLGARERGTRILSPHSLVHGCLAGTLGAWDAPLRQQPQLPQGLLEAPSLRVRSLFLQVLRGMQAPHGEGGTRDPELPSRAKMLAEKCFPFLLPLDVPCLEQPWPSEPSLYPSEGLHLDSSGGGKGTIPSHTHTHSQSYKTSTLSDTPTHIHTLTFTITHTHPNSPTIANTHSAHIYTHTYTPGHIYTLTHTHTLPSIHFYTLTHTLTHHTEPVSIHLHSFSPPTPMTFEARPCKCQELGTPPESPMWVAEPSAVNFPCCFTGSALEGLGEAGDRN